MKQVLAITLVIFITGCSTINKPMSDSQYASHRNQIDEWKAQESLDAIERHHGFGSTMPM